MASFRAISAVTEALLGLLRSSYDPDDFGNDLEFRVFTSRDFSNPIANGVSLFLYRIYPNGALRTPAHVGLDGRRRGTLLPVELHFLLTVWARDASLQHTVAGWMLRTLEDVPVLSSAFLSSVAPGVFGPDETVEVALTELANEDLLRIWEVLGLGVYQLSVPYVARVLLLEPISPPQPPGPVVQERGMRVGTVLTGGTSP